MDRERTASLSRQVVDPGEFNPHPSNSEALASLEGGRGGASRGRRGPGGADPPPPPAPHLTSTMTLS